MGMDKKVENGRIAFCTVKEIGRAVVYGDVPKELLQQTLQACCAGAVARPSGTRPPRGAVHG